MSKEKILNLLEEENLQEEQNLRTKKNPVNVGRLGGIIDPNRLKDRGNN